MRPLPKMPCKSPNFARAAVLLALTFAVPVEGKHLPTAGAQSAFDRATAYRNKHDLRSARIELLNAIADDPDWMVSQIAQAEVALELFDPVTAKAAIDRAIALGASPTETAHLSGEVYWLQGEPEKAREILARDDIAPANRVAADRVLARVYLDMGDSIAASRILDRAIAVAPNDSRLWTEIARYRWVIFNQGGAIEAADRALQLDANNIRALELRGRLVREQFGTAAAIPWFERALQVNANDIPVLEEYAATLGDAGRSTDMLAQARKIITLDSNNPKAFYMQAAIAARAGNFDLARRLLPRISGNFAELMGPRLLSAVVEYQAGNWNQAGDILANMVDDQPLNLNLRKLLALSYYRSGDLDEAWTAIAPIVDRIDADSYTISLGAKILEAKGERVPANGRLARLAFPQILQPQALPVKSSIGPAANNVARAPKNARVVIPYIRLLLANGNTGAARENANRLLEGNAGVAAAHLVSGDVDMLSGNYRGAIMAYERARTISFTAPVMVRLAAAYRKAGNGEAAGKIIATFLENNPASLIGQRLWAYDLLDRKQWKDALGWLLKVRETLGYSDAILNANIARAYAGLGEFDQAVDESALAYRVQPANIMATYTYGHMLLKSGKHKKSAFFLLQKAAKIDPNRTDIAKDFAAAKAAWNVAKPKIPQRSTPAADGEKPKLATARK